MSESHAEKVQQTFLEALEVPLEQRDNWLLKECGSNTVLLTDVRSLLKHADPSVDLLEQNLDEVVADLPHLDAEPESSQPQETEEPQDVDCDQFLSKLSEVGVLSPDEFASVSDSVSSTDTSSDPRQLASQLVTEGKLTSYQASALLKGEPDLLIDKYLILDLIDVGGMGMVFKAIHRTMSRVVALKMISQQALASEDQIRRFKREVRVAATLEHPNIVRAYDADEAHGVNFLVMEYVRGDNLSRIVRNQGPLSLSQAVDCLRQAATGLQHAHVRGIVHRDIKPGNLLLDKEGTVKILDLGLAHIDDTIQLQPSGSETTDEGSGRPFISQSELTTAGAILGTASFMAPEQSLDAHLVDLRSDIYSLGCTFYYLLTGEAPYSGNTIFKVFVQHREAEIPSLKVQRPDVPSSVVDLFRKMVAKKPEDRFQSAGELLEAIEECQIPRPIPAKKQRPAKPTQPENIIPSAVKHQQPASPNTRRSPKLILTGTACSIGLIAAIALLWPNTDSSSQPSPGPQRFDPEKADLPVLTAAPPPTQSVVTAPVQSDSTSAADLLATGEWEWQVSHNLGPSINSKDFDFGADMTADECTLVFSTGRNNEDHEERNLWITTRPTPNDDWKKAELLPATINTDGNAEVPMISADGLELRFRRDGRWYLSKRKSLNDPWQESIPDPLSVGFRRDYRLTPNGLTAYRPYVEIHQDPTENEQTAQSGYLALWKRDSLDAPFGEKIDTPFPLKSKLPNLGSMSNDGRIFIYHDKEDGEPTSDKSETMLFMMTRPDWNTPWSEPGPVFKNDSSPAWQPRLLRDGKRFLFVSNRPGTQGATDIWMAKLVHKDELEANTPAEENSNSDL